MVNVEAKLFRLIDQIHFKLVILGSMVNRQNLFWRLFSLILTKLFDLFFFYMFQCLSYCIMACGPLPSRQKQPNMQKPNSPTENTAKSNKYRPSYNLNSYKHTTCQQTAQHSSIQPKSRPNRRMNSTSRPGKPNVQICYVHVYSNILVVLYAPLNGYPMVYSSDLHINKKISHPKKTVTYI